MKLTYKVEFLGGRYCVGVLDELGRSIRTVSIPYETKSEATWQMRYLYSRGFLRPLSASDVPMALLCAGEALREVVQ